MLLLSLRRLPLLPRIFFCGLFVFFMKKKLKQEKLSRFFCTQCVTTECLPIDHFWCCWSFYFVYVWFIHETLWAKWTNKTMQSNEQFKCPMDWVVTFKLTPTEPNRTTFVSPRFTFTAVCLRNTWVPSSVCVCLFHNYQLRLENELCHMRSIDVGGSWLIIFFDPNRRHDAIQALSVSHDNGCASMIENTN